MYVSLLDRLLYRRPFEGDSARRYAERERPAFGDLDDRLLDLLAPELGGDGANRRLLDVGCGPATFARRAAARFPTLGVIAIDPSRDFAQVAASTDRMPDGMRAPQILCAAGEALPLADRSIDVAMCLSSIRHVRDRAAVLRELRRVVRGRCVIVELDPAADRRRIANHADRLGSALLRHAFGPLVVRTAPPAAVITALAHAAGFATRALRADPVQPVYVMELA